jgi:hypothetical protein
MVESALHGAPPLRISRGTPMYEAILRNEKHGWEYKHARDFLTFQGVLRVDCRYLMPNGNFVEVVLFFATQAEGEMFLQSAAASLK